MPRTHLGVRLIVQALRGVPLPAIAYSTSSWSPLPLLVKPFEEYGTLTDRAYKITKGTGPGVSWNLVPEGGKRT